MTRVIWAGDEPDRSLSEEIMRRRDRRKRSTGSPWRWKVVAVMSVTVVLAIVVGQLEVQEIRVSGFQLADLESAKPRLSEALESRWVSVDTERLARELESDPWIRYARVSRLLPATIDVEVHEVEPAYRLVDGQAADADGHPLPIHDGLSLESYPLLTNELDDSTESARMLAELSDALSQSIWPWTEGLAEVRVSSEGGVELQIVSGPRIHLGGRDFVHRLRRLAAVDVDDLRQAASIDLRFGRQVVMVDGSQTASRGG